MLSRITILFSFLVIQFIPGFTIAQNICPNPGFEQVSGCPTGPGELNLASSWSGAGQPADLFNFCYINTPPAGCNDVNVPNNFAGYSGAHGGSAYAGFYTRMGSANQRTYIQAPLVSAMSNGQLYKVTSYFKRSGFSKFATNRIGITFSTSALTQTAGQNIPVVPQLEINNVIADTANWTTFNAYYNAVGGEAFITIGNFRTDANTTFFPFNNPVPNCAAMNTSAFYYADDISVTVINETLNVTGDTVICTGQTTQITGITNTSGWWSLATLPNDTLPSVNNVLTVTPPSSTTYLWNCYQNTYTVTVSVMPPPVVVLPNDTTVCEGTEVNLSAYSPGNTYNWSTGDTISQITAADSGFYYVLVFNGACYASDTFQLDVIPTPEVTLATSDLLCANTSQFPVLDAGTGISYLWNSSDTTRYFTVISAGTYSVVVTHSNNCTRSASIEIIESCPETIFLPSAFSPNGDGKNDLYYGSGTNVFNYRIKIFNRWGQPIFESGSLGINGAWNGEYEDEPAPPGLYPYLVSYDGLKLNGKKKSETKSGYLLLIR